MSFKSWATGRMAAAVLAATVAGGAQEARIYVKNSFTPLDLLLDEAVSEYANGDSRRLARVTEIATGLRELSADSDVQRIPLVAAGSYFEGITSRSCADSEDEHSHYCYLDVEAGLLISSIRRLAPVYDVRGTETVFVDDLFSSIEDAVARQEVLLRRIRH